MKVMVPCLSFLFILPSFASAELSLSPREAITMALEKNNLVKAAILEEKAARHGASASRGRFFPRISLDETASAANAPTRVFMMKLDQGRFTQNDFEITNLNHPSTHGDFRTTLTLDQPIFDAGILAGADIAGKEEKLRGYALEMRRQEVAFTVYHACLDVQKAEGHLKTAEQAVIGAREHERLARVRGETGVGLKSDHLRARTFLSEMEQQQISAANGHAMAKLRLAKAVGGNPGESAGINGVIPPLPMSKDEDDLIRRAWENRSDLKEARMAAEKADSGVRSARAAYLPTLYGSASYQMNDRDIPFGRDNDAWMVGAALRWDLFDGFQRGKRRGSAEALAGAAAEYLEESRKEVALQVEESRLRCIEAEKRLEAARNSVEDSEEVVRLISRRFENSLATMVDLLDAQTALNRARAQLIDNQSDFALATARLYQATGTFLTEVMK